MLCKNYLLDKNKVCNLKKFKNKLSNVFFLNKRVQNHICEPTKKKFYVPTTRFYLCIPFLHLFKLSLENVRGCVFEFS